MMDLVQTTAREAGELLLSYFKKSDLHVELKKDGSKVTEADLAASDLIKKRLAPLGYPIVSEEDIPATRAGEEYFIVDPLDGTKYFADGEDTFATLIGFVSQHRPILGVAYFPKLDLFYSAEKGKGSYLNGEKIFNSPKSEALIAYSSGFHHKPQAQGLLKSLNIGKIIEGGSVLKLVKIAEGKGDFYPRFGPTSEWDTGACQIILEEAGCQIWDLKNLEPLSYGKPNYLNTGFVTFRNDIAPQITKIFKDIQWPRSLVHE